MRIDFSWRKAIVTGSSRGIGKAIGDCIEENGGEVIRTSTKNLDFTSKKSINEFITKIKKKYLK